MIYGAIVDLNDEDPEIREIAMNAIDRDEFYENYDLFRELVDLKFIKIAIEKNWTTGPHKSDYD